MPSAASPIARSLRRLVLFVSAVLLAFGLFRIVQGSFVHGALRLGNPVERVDPGRDGSLRGGGEQPRRVRAEVTRVGGNQIVRVSDKCEFLVERRRLEDGSFYCNAQVVCGGKLVYGGPDRGYFACQLHDTPRRDVVGSDPSTTGTDHDPALALDTRTGVLRVWDDARGADGAFDIEADVTDVN